jgi:F-type H+-transporting ATPase subunit epsilon
MVTMRLDITTAEGEVLSDDVELLVAPGMDGELGILPHHAPLMTMLQPGAIVIRREGQDTYLVVSGGFLEVMGNRVTILADACEQSDVIDEQRAQEAMRRAQERLANRPADMDLERATAALRRAETRLLVARRRSGRERPTQRTQGDQSSNR